MAHEAAAAEDGPALQYHCPLRPLVSYRQTTGFECYGRSRRKNGEWRVFSPIRLLSSMSPLSASSLQRFARASLCQMLKGQTQPPSPHLLATQGGSSMTRL
ncbi:hypothetical protein TraAM80_07319 [Trypanosoma rangeli]|uniref:Uncharacterized protein n=1 Tax=Trypanosoma rangeli TaxID=5698 RepID=A0A422N631_TRYRA|nr:uncharacterized protein TraAM80_07319 [Trypanosoma rangeli]RNF00928.1 hypothetical protein TraAM80_07319 [Trypanosoma rangeli]|eukprot:RNF00928.1 hypothetical protein TraAM80_07319 [Trypanosoma rangeli]